MCGFCASPVTLGSGHGHPNRAAPVAVITIAFVGLLVLLALGKVLVV
jgi:hypothetical protein